MDRSLVQTLFERYNTGLLPRGFDASASFRAHVPHRVSPEPGRCVPHADLESAVSVVLKGRFGVRDYSPAEVTALLKVCAQEGQWKAAISLANGRVQQRGEASAQDVEYVINALLNGRKRKFAMQYLSLHANVVLQPAVYARLLEVNQYRELDTDAVLYMVSSHYLPFDYNLFQTALRVTSRQSWVRGLQYYHDNEKALVNVSSSISSHDSEEKTAGDALVPLLRALFRPSLSKFSSTHVAANNDEMKRVEGIRILQHLAEVAPNELPSALITSLGEPSLSKLIGSNHTLHELFQRATSTQTSTKSYTQTLKDPIALPPRWALATMIWQNNRTVATIKALVPTVLTVAPSHWPVVDKALAAMIPSRRQPYYLPESAITSIVNELQHPPSVSTRNLATSLLRRTILRKQFAPSGLLAAYIGGAGDWSTALEHFSDSLALRGTQPNKHELSFCVQAAAWSGKSAQSLFWLERGHGASICFPPCVYDAAFQVQDLTHSVSRARAERAATSVKLLRGTIGETGRNVLQKHGIFVNKQQLLVS